MKQILVCLGLALLLLTRPLRKYPLALRLQK